MFTEFKKLNDTELEKLINALKNEESGDGAEETLREFCEYYDFDFCDFQEYLALDCNCRICATCGRYFGIDEFSDNYEDCIYCYEEENN